mgnify:CR=1 FL=1
MLNRCRRLVYTDLLAVMFQNMALREKIIENGNVTIHFVGVGQKDYALCGQDLAGDSKLGYEESEGTKERVTCRDCIAIVEYCKKIKRSEWRS